MEKFIISLKPDKEKDATGLEYDFMNQFKDMQAACDFARMMLLSHQGIYREAVVKKRWKSDLSFRQCCDAIEYNYNL